MQASGEDQMPFPDRPLARCFGGDWSLQGNGRRSLQPGWGVLCWRQRCGCIFRSGMLGFPQEGLTPSSMRTEDRGLQGQEVAIHMAPREPGKHMGSRQRSPVAPGPPCLSFLPAHSTVYYQLCYLSFHPETNILKGRGLCCCHTQSSTQHLAQGGTPCKWHSGAMRDVLGKGGVTGHQTLLPVRRESSLRRR